MSVPPDSPYPPPPPSGSQYPPPGQPPTPPAPPPPPPLAGQFSPPEPTAELPVVPPYGAPPSPYGAPPAPGGPTYPPPPGGGEPGSGQSNNRGPMIAIIAVLVVAALAVGGYFAFKGDNKKKTPVAAAGSPSVPATGSSGSFPSESGTPSDTVGTPSVTDTGSGGPGSWSDFAGWENLIGSSDGSLTVKNVGNLTCQLHAGSSSAVIDYVDCNNGGSSSPIEILVAQYSSAGGVTSDVQDAINKGAKHVKWTSNGTAYGTKYTLDDNGVLTIATSFCAIPTYELFIGTQNTNGGTRLSETKLNDVWKAAPFPSTATSQACS